MTTRTTISRIRHDSDATFREWIQEFEAALAFIGLVQTADTGQINTATANRPAINASAGYQIWRFNDTLQATAPIFIRIEYRTQGGATDPGMSFGIGTSTNGAGTLTGTNFVPLLQVANTAQITDTTRSSFWCAVDGFFGMDWKVGSGSTGCVWVICRTVDNTGAPTADGLLSLSLAQSMLHGRYMRFGSGAVASADQTTASNLQLTHWPFGLTTSLVGSDPQVATAWVPMPRMMPVVGVVGVLNVDAAQGTTFPFTGVGTTPRTYLACSNYTHMNSSSQLKPAILWE